jgi:hypothetical protein
MPSKFAATYRPERCRLSSRLLGAIDAKGRQFRRRGILYAERRLNFFKKNNGCKENNVLLFFVILHRFTVLISTQA